MCRHIKLFITFDYLNSLTTSLVKLRLFLVKYDCVIHLLLTSKWLKTITNITFNINHNPDFWCSPDYLSFALVHLYKPSLQNPTLNNKKKVLALDSNEHDRFFLMFLFYWLLFTFLPQKSAVYNATVLNHTYLVHVKNTAIVCYMNYIKMIFSIIFVFNMKYFRPETNWKIFFCSISGMMFFSTHGQSLYFLIYCMWYLETVKIHMAWFYMIKKRLPKYLGMFIYERVKMTRLGVLWAL